MRVLSLFFAVACAMVSFVAEAAGTAIPGVELRAGRPYRMGNGVIVPLNWYNDNEFDVEVWLDFNRFIPNQLAVLSDGDTRDIDSDRSRVNIAAKSPFRSYLFVDKVNRRVDMLSRIKVRGWAFDALQHRHDYEYVFSGMAVEDFPRSATTGMEMTNPDFDVRLTSVRRNGRDVEVTWTIKNTSEGPKNMPHLDLESRAYDAEGNQYSIENYGPSNFEPGIPVKFVTLIKNGAYAAKIGFANLIVAFADYDRAWRDCRMELKNFNLD